MSAKKTTKKTTKKSKQCNCSEKCKCACNNARTLVPFYVLIAILVALGTLLIISLAFDKSVREIFKPEVDLYSGMFESESTGEKKDENNIKLLSAGAVVDMITTGKTGFVIVSEENCIGCDAFARRVAKYATKLDDIYRYNASVDATDINDERAKEALRLENDVPDFVYIKDGVVYDRIDDVKDIDDLKFFLKKYN